jgi:hypothetical protein
MLPGNHKHSAEVLACLLRHVTGIIIADEPTFILITEVLRLSSKQWQSALSLVPSLSIAISQLNDQNPFPASSQISWGKLGRSDRRGQQETQLEGLGHGKTSFAQEMSIHWSLLCKTGTRPSGLCESQLATVNVTYYTASMRKISRLLLPFDNFFYYVLVTRQGGGVLLIEVI